MMMFWIGNVSGNGYSDYYPFGMQMPQRNDAVSGYRYGFNGMEGDSEVKGSGNSYTTEFRQYDPRLGRWLSLDPLAFTMAYSSPYEAFAGNPIYFTDPNGLKPKGKNKKGKNKKHSPKFGGDSETLPSQGGGDGGDNPAPSGPPPKKNISIKVNFRNLISRITRTPEEDVRNIGFAIELKNKWREKPIVVVYPPSPFKGIGEDGQKTFTVTGNNLKVEYKAVDLENLAGEGEGAIEGVDVTITLNGVEQVITSGKSMKITGNEESDEEARRQRGGYPFAGTVSGTITITVNPTATSVDYVVTVYQNRRTWGWSKRRRLKIVSLERGNDQMNPKK